MAIPHRLYSKEAPAEAVPAKSVDSTVVSELNLSNDAEAVAARIVARYNVERRQAGEPPVDLRGIERLRRLIAEEIERVAEGESSPDVH